MSGLFLFASKAASCGVILVCLVIRQVGEAVAAGPETPPVQVSSSRRDDIWIVSCRAVGHLGSTPNLNQLVYGRHVSNRGWTSSDQHAFLSSDSRSSATIVFVPGDGYTYSQTRDLGMHAYQRMIAGLPSEVAVRFVIWSWPSDQVARRRVRDLRIKASRTPWVAWCLSHWLDTIERGSPICLIGTGFGARIVGESLHLRGGGKLGGYQLIATNSRSPVRAVLISAAIDNDWLLPGRRLGHALSSVERMLVVTNSSDPVLVRYRWLYGIRSRAVALGYAGLAGGSSKLTSASRIEQVDAASLVGPNHGFMYYFSVPQVVARIQPYASEPGVRLLARDPRDGTR
jgi:hypothetical protein